MNTAPERDAHQYDVAGPLPQPLARARPGEPIPHSTNVLAEQRLRERLARFEPLAQ